MEYLEPVAYEKFKDSEGINRDSPNKLYALRLIAETMHSKGKIDEATEIYEQIKNNFADANRTLEILQEKTMKIDDLITVPIEENTAINVKHKNIKKITAKIYKVDFVILALTEKDLSDVTKVNLSGIKPMIEKEYELEYDELYLPSETNIDLPITEMGAYLVVIRSDFGERSAIVIKSDYRIDVVEKSNGRVRVIVTDKNNNFVSGMKMYFIGSNNQSFKVTETDIRGIAEVEGINGRVMIIGNLEGQYIFYRGESGLNGYSYGYEQSVNDLLEINNQRTQLQNTNISILNSILNNFPNSISIQNMYKSTN
jgi:alpha-2-macroglobulin